MLGLVDKLIGPVSTVLDKFVEDKDQKAALAHEIARGYKRSVRDKQNRSSTQ